MSDIRHSDIRTFGHSDIRTFGHSDIRTFYFSFASIRAILPPNASHCPGPRTARAGVGDITYHVINRGNGRATVFHSDGDFRAFVNLLADANARFAARPAGRTRPLRILAYCLMRNHCHLVLWPRRDGDLSRWMQWLLTAHVRR